MALEKLWETFSKMSYVKSAAISLLDGEPHLQVVFITKILLNDDAGVKILLNFSFSETKAFPH